MFDETTPATTDFVQNIQFSNQGFNFGSNLKSESLIEENSPNQKVGVFRDFSASYSNDKTLLKWDHYFDVFDTFLGEFVGKSPTLLEIGVAYGGSYSSSHFSKYVTETKLRRYFRYLVNSGHEISFGILRVF
jgi:hypothetical protein